MLASKLTTSFVGSSSSSAPTSDEVFSTYLYTGNGSTQTINNGINLYQYMMPATKLYVASHSSFDTTIRYLESGTDSFVFTRYYDAFSSLGIINVTKYDASGTVVFQKNMTSSFDLVLKDVFTDASGNIIMVVVNNTVVRLFKKSASTFTDVGDSYFTTAATGVHFVAKYGSEIFIGYDSRKILKINENLTTYTCLQLSGTNFNDNTIDFAIDSSGNYIIAQSANSSDLRQNITKVNSSTNSIIWSKNYYYGSGSSAYPESRLTLYSGTLKILNNGDIVIGGRCTTADTAHLGVIIKINPSTGALISNVKITDTTQTNGYAGQSVDSLDYDSGRDVLLVGATTLKGGSPKISYCEIPSSLTVASIPMAVSCSQYQTSYTKHLGGTRFYIVAYKGAPKGAGVAVISEPTSAGTVFSGAYDDLTYETNTNLAVQTGVSLSSVDAVSVSFVSNLGISVGLSTIPLNSGTTLSYSYNRSIAKTVEASNGGMVWTKSRSNALNHYIADTIADVYLIPNATNGSQGAAFTGSNDLTGVTSNGYTLGPSLNTTTNGNGQTFVSWTFRRAPKFFDVVTYTGNGGTKVVSHALGSAPGMIVVKRTDATGDWPVYHQSVPANCGFLNVTNSFASAQRFSSVTSTDFTINVATADVNASGATYVAYLFAHDTSTDGIIQCGSFTTDGSGNATVNLGWEPQWLMTKRTSSARDWNITDSMRGWPVNAAAQKLYPNLSNAESSGNENYPNATGFAHFGGDPSANYVYVAIRRPNKPPTTGTQVYNAIERTGTGAAATVTGVGFAPDLLFQKTRGTGTTNWWDRVRGKDLYLHSDAVDADSVSVGSIELIQDGAQMSGNSGWNGGATNYINHFFKRSVGCFDIVCYTGTGSATTIPHSLGVVPELVIFKSRSDVGNWRVYCDKLTTPLTTGLTLQSTNAVTSFGTGLWTSFSSSTFGIANNGELNTSPVTIVTYLFATKAGISKVGTYTGNGGTQTINCGFSAGARFVMCKRTDATGNWIMADSVRGISSSSDPALYLNSTAAEVTGVDWIDPNPLGFDIVQEGTMNANVNGATYIYLAFA